MAKVGMPIMKLDRLDHFGRQSENSGNARAVACEALEERRSSDPDLDRDFTIDNLYDEDDGMFKSGEELCDYWEELADNYKVVDKNGKEKKLKSDAGIGFAGICKPDKEFMDSLSYREQLQFIDDAIDCIKEIYNKRGMIIDAVVAHFDEGNPHFHYFGHDPEYRLGRKLGLPFKAALNKAEFPPMMRAKGWNIEDLTGYQEETEGMTEDELKAEKKRRKQNRKHGKSSSVYKAEKDLEKAESKRLKLQADNMCLTKENARLKAENESIMKLADEMAQKVQAVKRQEAQARALKAECDNLTVEAQNLVNKLKNGINELENAKGRLPETDEYLKKALEQQEIKLKGGKVMDGWTYWSKIASNLRDADIKKTQDKAKITAEQLVKNVELGIGFDTYGKSDAYQHESP